MNNDISTMYTNFYSKRRHLNVYPNELVVRTLLSNYPNLNLKKPKPGDSILDVAFGDGRNTVLLCDLFLDVYGIEITKEIVSQTSQRLAQRGYKPNLDVGRNSNMPYENEKFDYMLACHCCYYCDEGETLLDNLAEYCRVLKKGAFLIASVADIESYIFNDAEKLDDGTMIIKNDPYGVRNGYRLKGFASSNEIEEYFSKYFTNFSFARADNNYYGVEEKLFWLVCEKK